MNIKIDDSDFILLVSKEVVLSLAIGAGLDITDEEVDEIPIEEAVNDAIIHYVKIFLLEKAEREKEANEETVL